MMEQAIADNIYEIFLGIILIASNYAIIKTKLTAIEKKVDQHEKEIQAIKSVQDKTITALQTEIRNQSKLISQVLDKMSEYDKNIREFYEKYDLTKFRKG